MTVTDLRPFTLGGSDAAAAAGIHPYMSDVELWARKTGRWTDNGAGEAAEWGLLLEPLLTERYELVQQMTSILLPITSSLASYLTRLGIRWQTYST